MIKLASDHIVPDIKVMRTVTGSLIAPSPVRHSVMPTGLGFEGYVWTDAETQTTLDRGLHFRRIYVSVY